MKEKKTSPLRERVIEDMRIRGMSAKTQQAHIRAVRYFAELIGRSSDTATPDEYPYWSRQIGLPIAPFAQHCVCAYFDAAHDRGDGDLLGFSCFQKCLIFFPKIVVQATGQQCGHIDRPSNGCAPPVIFSLPCHLPDCCVMGASPARAAIFLPSRWPNSSISIKRETIKSDAQF